MTIPKLTPTADDTAVFGKLTNEQLAKAFVDYTQKALTWIDYWPKAKMPDASFAKEAAALLERGKTFMPTAQAIVEGVKKALGISGVGFLPAVATVVTWVTAALASVTLANTLRVTLIAACGYLYRWLTENSTLEAKRKEALARIEAQKEAVIAAARAKTEVQAALKAEGFTDAEVARMMQQYEREAAPKAGALESIESIVKWAAIGGAVYYGAKAAKVI